MIIEDAWDKTNGRTISIEGELIDELQSEYQDIKVYETKCFGKLLQLDGVIQLTEFDEANYHEMMVHVPMMTHENARRVLVIGGGDGGAVRELVKYNSVKQIDMVEIDECVVDISKRHLPNISCGLSDHRVNLYHEDGAEFIKNHSDYYDVIIVDSTDPFSVGESLFQENFYSDIKKSLREHGIVVSQSESMFYNADLIFGKLKEFKSKYFKSVEYYYTMVPTYPSGTIGFQICSDGYYDSKKPFDLYSLSDLKYYNYDVHRGSFMLPNGVK